MRSWICFSLAVMLASCASMAPFDGRIEIRTTAQSQPLQDAQCEVETGAGKWTVSTPGLVQVGKPQGDLSVVCHKEGYRSSEVVFRRSAGAPGGSSVGVGVGGGFGGYSSVGVSLGFGFPLSSGRGSYPSQVVVDMTPL